MSKFRIGLYAVILVAVLVSFGVNASHHDLSFNDYRHLLVVVPFAGYMLWKFGFNPSIPTKLIHVKTASVDLGYSALVDKAGKVMSDEDLEEKWTEFEEEEEWEAYFETLDERFITVKNVDEVPENEEPVYRVIVEGEVQNQKYALKEIKYDDLTEERTVGLPKTIGLELEFKGRRRSGDDHEFEAFRFENMYSTKLDLQAIVIRGTDATDYKQIWGEHKDVKRTRNSQFKLKWIVVGAILVAGAIYFWYTNR